MAAYLWYSPGSVGDNSPEYFNHMKSEYNRLNSFMNSNWPRSRSQTPADLARAGLFYTSISDRVQCPFCFGVLKNWVPSDIPETEHSRHFPYCRFIHGLNAGNVPLESHGFTDTVSNVYTRMSSTPVNIIPPHATNIVIYPERELSAFEDSSSVFFDFTNEENRLKTFSRWPPNLRQRPGELARAGFYHIPGEGRLDRVRCAYCQGKLLDWEPSNDPWIEHKRCFPHCQYIKLCMEDDAQTRDQTMNSPCSVQDEERPSTSPPTPEPPPPLPVARPSTPHLDEDLTPRMKSEPVETVLEMGFQENIVRNIFRKCLRERPGHFPSAEELASMVMELEDPEPAEAVLPRLTPLQKMMAAAAGDTGHNTMKTVAAGTRKTGLNMQVSNGCRGSTRVKESFLCKICMENQIRVTFMPCGHLACCERCSASLTECPICRQYITDRVRTYF